MDTETMFKEIGFIAEYRREMEVFYRSFFDNDDDMTAFFLSVFNSKSKEPRYMMNQIHRYISLARDIDQIRRGCDSLKVLFFKTCEDALKKISDDKDFWNSFPECFSDSGKEYILNNFVLIGIACQVGTTRETRNCCSSCNNCRLTINEFLNVIKAVRDILVHDGISSTMQLFAVDPVYPLITNFTTEEKILNCNYIPKNQELIYCFQTTMQYVKFEYHFTKACIEFVKKHI